MTCSHLPCHGPFSLDLLGACAPLPHPTVPGLPETGGQVGNAGPEAGSAPPLLIYVTRANVSLPRAWQVGRTELRQSVSSSVLPSPCQNLTTRSLPPSGSLPGKPFLSWRWGGGQALLLVAPQAALGSGVPQAGIWLSGQDHRRGGSPITPVPARKTWGLESCLLTQRCPRLPSCCLPYKPLLHLLSYPGLTAALHSRRPPFSQILWDTGAAGGCPGLEQRILWHQEGTGRGWRDRGWDGSGLGGTRLSHSSLSPDARLWRGEGSKRDSRSRQWAVPETRQEAVLWRAEKETDLGLGQEHNHPSRLPLKAWRTRGPASALFQGFLRASPGPFPSNPPCSGDTTGAVGRGDAQEAASHPQVGNMTRLSRGPVCTLPCPLSARQLSRLASTSPFLPQAAQGLDI